MTSASGGLGVGVGILGFGSRVLSSVWVPGRRALKEALLAARIRVGRRTMPVSHEPAAAGRRGRTCVEPIPFGLGPPAPVMLGPS